VNGAVDRSGGEHVLDAAQRLQPALPARAGVWGCTNSGLPCKQTLPDRPTEFTHPTGCAHLRGTSSWCQRRSVCGGTASPWRRPGGGSSRASAASNARSAGRSRGRRSCRPSTASWCRSTSNLRSFGELAAPAPDQQPRQSREGEIGERKKHAPILSSPDAKGSTGERFGLGGSPSVAKPSPIWYTRARVNHIKGPSSERCYQGGQSNR
jgi:hypothetical protein